MVNVKERKLHLSRDEANLIRFYGGLDSCLYSIEREIDRVEMNKIGDWKEIIAINKRHLKTIKNLEKRIMEFLGVSNG